MATIATDGGRDKPTTASPQSTPRIQRWHLEVLALSIAVKVLLFPSYHSTDMEVHRHWLALTSSLPMSQWYFDVTSEWTLDYPPFFAYFSYLLALPARLIDAKIVHLTDGLEYAAWACKAYMRSTVVVTELVLASALWALTRPPSKQAAEADPSAASAAPSSRLVAAASITAAAILLHPGLIIVDHIHFQYNGFLFGVLLWSVWAAREERPLLCAFLFSSLLCLKHIYVYIAPAYFVFLLRTYVLPPKSTGSTAGPPERLFTLGVITLIPPALAFAPFLLAGLSPKAPAGPFGILAQIFRRLFPFARGLNHAYWAANAWALYTAADRIGIKVVQRFPGVAHALLRDAPAAAISSASRGLVEDTVFGTLPTITASHCFVFTLIPIFAYAAKLWQVAGDRDSAYVGFLHTLALNGLTSFIFGYHVHEKAILLALLPLTLLAPYSWSHLRSAALLSLAGIVGLMPLLFESRETPIKIVYSALWGCATYFALHRLRWVNRPTPNHGAEILIHELETAYMAGFVPLLLYTEGVHPLVFAARKGRETVPSQEKHGTTTTEAVIPVTTAEVELEEIPSDAEEDDSSAPAESDSTSAAIVEQIVSQASSLVAPVATPALQLAGLVPTIDSSATQPPPSTMEFLPLMLTSVYCALGVCWVWVKLSWLFLAWRRRSGAGPAK